MRILAPVDFAKNEIQNVVVHKLASAPSSPIEGQIYYDTAGHILYYRDNTTWVAAGSTGASGTAGGDLTGTYPNPTIGANKVLTAHILDGNVTIAKIGTSTFNTQVQLSRLDQMAAPTASVSLNSQKIVSLADPTANTDAANKQYVDALAGGLDAKNAVRVATTTNAALATAYENGDTVDGVTLATGDRILLKDQTTASENGIYTVNASGAPTRAADANANGEIKTGTIVYVTSGTANGGQQWVVTATGATPWVAGTSTSTWGLFFAVTATQAGAGLTATGNVLAVGQGTGITVNANDVAIDTAVVVRKFTTQVGDGSTTTYTVTHNLNTRNVTVSVAESATPWEEVQPQVKKATVNTVTLTFSTAPTTNQYDVTVHG
jgi:hypothetical protein